jgi:creatinine amidohydrolase/Fe(II)-dependent formamide hydrolase-like protein
MKKAVVEYMPGASTGVLSLDPKNPRYNASGVFGDATLATVAKGRIVVDGMSRIIKDEIEELRRAALPKPGE